MKWSYRIATIQGIDLKLHVTFAFIVLLVATNWAASGLAGAAFGVTLILLLFACITLHEFGHALAARYFGIPVREVVLLPIGGVAMLERQIRRPVEELVIAAAGPAVNVAIAAVLALVLQLVGEPVTAPRMLVGPDDVVPSAATAVHWLLGANITLVLFNLIPAFPMDGGRILRGLLGLVVGWPVATRWAARTGQVLAVAMGVWAVFQGHVMLAVIATMVFFSAAATDADEQARTVLSSRTTASAYTRHPLVLEEFDRVSTAVGYLLTSYQTEFAVMRGHALLGVIRRADILRAVAAGRGDLSVTSFMTDPVRVASDDALDLTRQRLLESGSPVAAVYRDGRFAGLISLDDIGEAEAIFSALGQDSHSTPSKPATGRWRMPAEA